MTFTNVAPVLSSGDMSRGVLVWRMDDLPGVELWRFPGSTKGLRLRYWAYGFCLTEDERAPGLSYWHRRESWTLSPRTVALFEPGAVLRSQGAASGPFLVLMVDPRWVEVERLGRAPHHLGDGHHLALAALTVALRRAHAPFEETRRAFDGFMASLAFGAGSSARAAVKERVAIVRARRILEEHLAEALGLDEVARASGLSKFYLLRTFNRCVGVSPFEYRRLVRLGRALELLREGGRPAWVSAETGFADQSHLTRSLRKTLGITPARYRRTDPFVSGSSSETRSPD